MGDSITEEGSGDTLSSLSPSSSKDDGQKGLGLSLKRLNDPESKSEPLPRKQQPEEHSTEEPNNIKDDPESLNEESSVVQTPQIIQQSAEDLRTPPLSAGPSSNPPSQFTRDDHSDHDEQQQTSKEDHKLSETSPETQKIKSEQELADSLKTRLSYAFLKMQKGWADYSLDHLENLQARKEAKQIIQDLADENRQIRNRGSVVPVSSHIHSTTFRSKEAVPSSALSESSASSPLKASPRRLAPPPLFQVNTTITSNNNMPHHSYTEQALTPASTPPKPQKPREHRSHRRTSCDSQLVPHFIRKLGPTAASSVHKYSYQHSGFGHNASSPSDRKGKRKPDLWTASSVAGDLAHSMAHRASPEDDEPLSSPTSRPEADAVESLMFLSSPGTKFRKSSVRE